MGAALLMVLFAAYYCGSTLFVHSHATWQGMVTHSHPYLPSAAHSHTDAQYGMISLLNLILLEPAAETAVPVAYEAVTAVMQTPPETDAAVPALRAASLRAPPFFA